MSATNQPWPGLRPSTEIGEKLLASTPLYGFGRLAEKLLLLDRLDGAYAAARKHSSDQSFFANLLDCLNIRYECPQEDLARIPAQGPVVVVCNHPFGLAEGPVIASMLGKVRKDVRVMANSLLAGVDELRELVIGVDPFGGRDAARSNVRQMRVAIEWVKQGGLLVVFPAGEVASFRFPRFHVADPAWSETIGRVIRMTGATVIPVYFHGANSAGFHVMGMFHPRLRTALLPRELLNKGGHTLHVSVGQPIEARTQVRFSNRELVPYLRMRTELLQARGPRAVRSPSAPHWPRPPVARQAAIAGPADSARMLVELERLTPTLVSGDLAAFVAHADEIPETLLEIGRLREVSFRAVGEGSGRSRDLDSFDEYYRHLLVWNHARPEIVGAYRLGLADEILARRGPRGLYTATLFRFQRDFFAKLGSPALELGRSFVRPEYQKNYLSLLMLWKGIGHFVAANPRYRLLFGPVSISNDYRSISRALMVEFFKAHHGGAGGSVQPKHRFHSSASLWSNTPGCDAMALGALAGDVDELSNLVADLEPDKKGVPVLLRQYLNVGGKILEFNLDHRFSSAIDGLIFVDLLNADPKLLARYMSREGLAGFRAYHQAGSETPREASSGETKRAAPVS